MEIRLHFRAVVSGHRADNRGSRNGMLLLLPREQEFQDHGIVQELGAPVRSGRA